MLRPLREVWLEIGIEKLDSHKRMTVKVLLNSGTTELFVDKKFVEEHGFKLEKLDWSIEVKNMDGVINFIWTYLHE